MNIAHTTGEDTSWHDFDDFLQAQFMQDEPESIGCKDTFEDNFANWLNQLDPSEWIEYGNKFNKLNK